MTCEVGKAVSALDSDNMKEAKSLLLECYLDSKVFVGGDPTRYDKFLDDVAATEVKGKGLDMKWDRTLTTPGYVIFKDNPHASE